MHPLRKVSESSIVTLSTSEDGELSDLMIVPDLGLDQGAPVTTAALVFT